MPEQPDDLAGSASWLRERRMAHENRIPYFVKWVRRFQGLARGRPSGESWYDTLSVFLEDLEQGGIPDWQIRQAADAVTLFCSQFRDDVGDCTEPGLTEGNDPAPLTGRSAGESSIPERPEAMLSELERVLRLRHYSRARPGSAPGVPFRVTARPITTWGRFLRWKRMKRTIRLTYASSVRWL